MSVVGHSCGVVECIYGVLSGSASGREMKIGRNLKMCYCTIEAGCINASSVISGGMKSLKLICCTFSSHSFFSGISELHYKRSQISICKLAKVENIRKSVQTIAGNERSNHSL